MGKKTIIHVNQHNIKANRSNGTDIPVLTCKTYNSNEYAHEVILRDKDGVEIGRIVYRKDNPLSCGAHVWMEFNTDNITIETVVRDHSPS